MIGAIRRGGVYVAQAVEGGERPVVVVSWDSLNGALRKPIVCTVTSTDRERALATAVSVPAGEAGLERDSYVLCHELSTLVAERFRREVGLFSRERMLDIERALRVALDLG